MIEVDSVPSVIEHVVDLGQVLFVYVLALSCDCTVSWVIADAGQLGAGAEERLERRGVVSRGQHQVQQRQLPRRFAGASTS